MSAIAELVSSRKPEITEGFEIFPLETETVATETVAVTPKRGRPVGSKNKPEKAKRSRGRPRVYNGNHRRIAAAALRKHGLTGAVKFLATERKLNVSLTFLRSVAKEIGIEFKRGRPAA